MKHKNLSLKNISCRVKNNLVNWDIEGEEIFEYIYYELDSPIYYSEHRIAAKNKWFCQILDNYIRSNSSNEENIFKRCIQNYNIPEINQILIDSNRLTNYPNLLNVACKSNNTDIILHMLSNKVQPDENTFRIVVNRMKPATKFIKLLCDYGYNLTYDDVLYATKKDIYIADLDKLPVFEKLDINFIEGCLKSTCVLDYNFTIKNLDLDKLSNLVACCSDLKTFIKYTKLYNLKYNITHLELACGKKRNTSVIKYLAKTYNLKYNLSCLINYIKTYSTKLCYKIFNSIDFDNK